MAGEIHDTGYVWPDLFSTGALILVGTILLAPLLIGLVMAVGIWVYARLVEYFV